MADARDAPCYTPDRRLSPLPKKRRPRPKPELETDPHATTENTPQTWEEMEREDEGTPDVEMADDTNVDTNASAEPEAEDEEIETKEEASGGEDEVEEGVDEDAGEESVDNQEKSASPARRGGFRRKRLGRPPKNRPPDWDGGADSAARDSDATPRRRGRGGYRGRGGRKGAPAPVTQQAVDKEGTMVDIVDDELALPEDPIGETKVDKMGRLEDGREYRCRTFTVIGHGNRLYMLSTEPARCVGFRDSYLFFTKHKRLHKIIADEEEKRDLIERDIIPHSYKGRSIGIVTARSVYREFGAMIIVGGKRVIDDYDMTKAKEEGWVEGDIADPTDKIIPGEPYNRNQYVAWHGASSVYHNQNQPSVPEAIGRERGPVLEAKKRKIAVNDVNWQLEHAREASNFNTQLSAVRKLNLNGVYDIHTNTMQYPALMQPTQARMVQVSSSDFDMSDVEDSSMFPPLKPRIERNYLVIDTQMEAPEGGVSTLSYDAGPRMGVNQTTGVGSEFLAGFRGLGAVSDDILSELPADCRRAFDAALAKEKAWHSRWGSESIAKSRRDPVIDKAIVPYSMPR